MAEKLVLQYGEKSVYVDNNNGNIYINRFATDAERAFVDGSFDLEMYKPSINPPIKRAEVEGIASWIDQELDAQNPVRIGLLYGKPGIGKSIVMHDLLSTISVREDYLVLGLKSDQMEFTDTDHLSKMLHLAQPLEEVIRLQSAKFKRIVLLIDQIDALSLSLSSNRTPLRSLLKLIQRIQGIPNVRIVISCRPYDLEYDPILDQINTRVKWELKEFAPEEVKAILKANNFLKELSSEVLFFLGNPLHLSLFLRIKDKSNLRYPLTEEDLYDEIWRVTVCDADETKVNRTQLHAFLDRIVNQMYRQQELSVREKLFETEFNAEINYLLHSELLLKTPSGQLQFFHQTMFDYVYARRFVENGRDLLEELGGKHQGLFIRSSVKSIMSFLRASNPKMYITSLVHILYDHDSDGHYVYRYHLRSLVLSTMAYFEEPIQEELDFINHKLFSDEEHFPVLLDAIHNDAWFKTILSIVKQHGGWLSLTETYKNSLTTIGRCILWNSPEVVYDFALDVLAYNCDEDRIRISNIFDAWEIQSTSDKLIEIYKQITISQNPLSNCYILKNLVSQHPDFVISELTENVRQQVESPDNLRYDKVQIGHYEHLIYEELEKRHPELLLDFYLSLINIIYGKDSILPDGFEIQLSINFTHFERCSNPYLTHDFSESLVNTVINKIIGEVNSGMDNQATLLRVLFETRLDVNVCIALCCYANAPQFYIKDIFEILSNHEVMANSPGWVEYYSAELLSVVFKYFSAEQKEIIIRRIMSIDDRYESKNVVKIDLLRRLEYGIPILWIGRRKGILLSLIPELELKNISSDAFQELLRIQRRFKPESLKNDRPYKMTSMSGWPSMAVDNAKKMSDDDWKKSMRIYNTDNNHDWNVPSLSGQQMVLQQEVSENPERKLNLLIESVSDETIPLSYPIYGMRGLLDANRTDLAERLFCAIVAEIGEDINVEKRNYTLHTFLFSLEGFIKGTQLPRCVFDFLCRALREANEDLSYRENNEKDIYNRGINLPRGNAAYKIVECCKFEEYVPEIFKVLEDVADEASEFTRSAILLNLAVLNNFDKDRNVSLFLKLMHDYHPLLMSMPVHNYNPLVYFVNYALDDLHDFFNHALDLEECYEQQVVILWLAWNHTHKDFARSILDEMCERSESARFALMNFLYRLDDRLDEDAVEYLCRFMHEKYASESMSEHCDNIFHNLDKVNDEYQKTIALNFVDSVEWRTKFHCFYSFLAGYAIKEPLLALEWLNIVIQKQMPKEFNDVNVVTDVLIQSYNGIKRFDETKNQNTLELAMDLLDKLMQLPGNKYPLTSFINKLDNE